MKLVDYINILWRRKWIIILTTLAILPVVIIGSRRLPAVYATAAKIRIVTPTTGSNDWVQYDVRYNERLLATYVEVAKTGTVINKVLARLRIDSEDLPEIEVRLIPNTELIEIKASSEDRDLAKQTADTLADIMVSQEVRFDYANEITAQRMPAVIVEKAFTPRNPSGIGQRTFMAMGGVMGFAGGIALALLFESLDGRMHTARQIASSTRLPLLGTLPTLKRSKNGKKETSSDDAMRLALRLFPPNTQAPQKTLLIASALPREGRSTVLAELALALANTGHRVVMVDANLRKPDLHSLFQLENTRGLSDVLQGDVQLADAVQSIATDKPLSLLTGGTQVAQPSRLLSAQALATLLDDLKNQFDVVLIDTPPMAASSDALFLAARVDVVLPMLSRGQTPREAFRGLQQQLTDNGAKILGFIINRAPKNFTFGSYAAARAEDDTTVRQDIVFQ